MDNTGNLQRRYDDLTRQLPKLYEPFLVEVNRTRQELRCQWDELSAEKELQRQRAEADAKRIADLENQVKVLKDYKSKYEQLHRQNGDYERENRLQELKISSLTSDKADLKAEITRLQTERRHLLSDSSKLNDEVGVLKATIEDLNEARRADLEHFEHRTRTELAQQAEKHREAMEDANNNLKASLRTCKAQIQQLQNQNARLSTENSQLNTKIVAFKQRVDTLTDYLETIQRPKANPPNENRQPNVAAKMYNAVRGSSADTFDSVFITDPSDRRTRRNSVGPRPSKRDRRY